MDDNWGNAWYLMMVYCLSGLFWVFGSSILVPGMLIYTVVESVDGFEAFWMMILGDEEGKYLSFDNFINYNFRRTVV